MNTGKKIAYVRVSTIEQDDTRQKEALKKYGIDKYFIEKISAKNAMRPELIAMLDYVREGDVVYVTDFSRIARSAKDLLEIVEKLKAEDVGLISLKENLDTNTSTGKLMLTVIGAIYEFERTNLLERQKEGIAIAKMRGRYKGRKKISFPLEWDSVYNDWNLRKITAKKAMQILDLKPNTFYRMLSESKKREEIFNHG